MKIGNFRAPFIDYRNPGIFMVTMNKAPGVMPFSSIVAGGVPNSPRVYVRCLQTGKVIQNCIADFTNQFPQMEIWRYIIMPDHLHFILNIKQRIEKTLGECISKWKRVIFHELQKSSLLPPGQNTIFEKGFNDQFLKRNRSLKIIKQYILRNPYRLWVMQNNPDYFKTLSSLKIGETDCSVYGNISLLENPLMEQVIAHRSETVQEQEDKKERWRYSLYNGGVIVSPFIAPREKEIRDEAFNFGGKIIMVSDKFYGGKEKPQGRLFQHCETGNLVIVTPKIDYSIMSLRARCLFLNEISRQIAERNTIGSL